MAQDAGDEVVVMGGLGDARRKLVVIGNQGYSAFPNCARIFILDALSLDLQSPNPKAPEGCAIATNGAFRPSTPKRSV